MATEGNIRYLQYILLLGEGSSLVLQGIANREARKRQKPLETVLEENRPLLQNKFRDELLFKRIFATNGSVNADMNTWDITLLTGVNLTLFKSTLTWNEKASIRFLKDMRNELLAHASTMSLENEDFQSLWLELSTTLTTLAAKLPQEIQDKCNERITELSKGLGNLKSTKEKIKMIAQNDDYFVQALELIVEKLDKGVCHVTDVIHGEVAVVREEMSKNKAELECKIQTSSEEMHEHVERKSSEIKETMQSKVQELNYSLNQGYGDVKQSTSDIKEGINDANRRLDNVHGEVSDIHETVCAIGGKIDEAKETLSQEITTVKDHVQSSVQGVEKKMEEMCDLIKSLLREGKEFRSPQVIGAAVDVEGPDEDVTSEAEEQLFKEFEKARASALAIAKKAKTSDDPRAIEELGKVVRQFLEKIENIEDVITDEVHRHCIMLKMRCNTGVGMLELLTLFASSGIQENLEEIGNVLTRHYGKKFSVTARVVPESVQKAIDHLLSGTVSPVKRTMNIPIRCKTLAGMAQVCELFAAEETASCFDYMSTALSKKLGRKVTVKASLNIAEVKKALTNTDVNEPSTLNKEISNKMIETPRLKEGDDSISEAAEGFTTRRMPYRLKSYKQISVRLNDDKHVCSVYGCCCLPDGNFLLADYSNWKLKRLNRMYEVVDYCVLPAKPWDVCYIGNGEAAVSLNNNAVQFVNVDGQMSHTRVVKCAHSCWGITGHGDRMYIKGGASVFSYDQSGEDKRILFTDPSGESSFRKIEANQDGSKIYITDDTASFNVIDENGKIIGTFTDPSQKGTTDVCLDGEGNVYVCSEKSSSIVQVDAENLENMSHIITPSDGARGPWCICFDRSRNAVIIGHLRSDSITVADVEM
ncbi:uncharacterized protein LOC123544561 [Mercenaria mercenaria]|uniref:uncharacterized protein LOC123544561 n=1 Tax=Mercenaria mercenaria TaxID=6596 RepID=UPI00234E7F68|nr:uncharacterized protein LOC123544561 [Mercenaria mercenaria]XP_053373378.1 uncharacterized protein LOC123544561 [Mercenaria mercenaria]XP_053373379.1 uncharacterized protein LOC123544561 [Mercenaria mercenaria]XP_053373380.1 uncharacterized protein LOC123544561 [Mercenaria mercenaria]XP_053373381.1 uncharacterized protein LOC123544561 [Mercenaria mercenaria]